MLFDALDFVSGGVSRSLSVQCLITDNYTYYNLLAVALAPVVFGVPVLAMLLFWAKWREHASTQDWFRRKVWVATTCIVFLFQPTIISTSLAMFTCYTVGDHQLMYSDMNIECWTPSHLRWSLLVALPAMLAYGVAAPIAVLLRMYPLFTGNSTSGLSEDARDEAERWFAPFIKNYNEEFWW